MAWTYELFGFELDSQSEGEWCWAAVTVGVSHFYNSGSTWDQCHLAKSLCDAGNPCDCCNNGAAQGCNEPRRVQDALNLTKNWADGPVPVADDLDSMMSRVASELQAHRPVIAELAWPGDIGAHVVVIAAIDTTNQKLHVLDPSSDGETHDVGYQDFHYIYKGTGTWTNSFFTCSRQTGSPNADAGDAAGASERIAGEMHEKLSSGVRSLRSRSRPERTSTVERQHPPQPVYSISLNDLIRHGLRAAVKTGMRTIVELSDGTASAEVHLRPDGSAGDPMIARGAFVNEMRGNLRRVAERLQADPGVEARTVRIPGLHTEVLWLAGGDVSNEVVFLPRPAPPGLRGRRAYSRQEFETLIRDVAQQANERRLLHRDKFERAQA